MTGGGSGFSRISPNLTPVHPSQKDHAGFSHTWLVALMLPVKKVSAVVTARFIHSTISPVSWSQAVKVALAGKRGV